MLLLPPTIVCPLSNPDSEFVAALGLNSRSGQDRGAAHAIEPGAATRNRGAPLREAGCWQFDLGEVALTEGRRTYN